MEGVLEEKLGTVHFVLGFSDHGYIRHAVMVGRMRRLVGSLSQSWTTFRWLQIEWSSS